ncbi:hypothetical protein PBI_BLUEBERRY_10 [Gordonia phage Blueberry]|uniref:Uncharacterized protein n=1 Tax=Gordonia phage Azula TaxID=2762397 RepID=A0A7G8LKP9_9CAUD|nr:hypothetical protein BH771_gp10 [Gordonia phage Blueberry]YP_010109936.1 hypothetical protein KNV23_gp10 [Gordonia phage Azula]QGJ97382.1 hypothetical protein SEA_GAMBINO_10 [Gordonia phage Gambino]QZD97442.1 hypothetical protein SEA_MISSRONA_10 [Gordonia phage MissRona]ANA85472.1 hypothetical protein PBI_BLUEBERRY_10 [Gordonia phage Blueberry]QNJ57821.1 hypothetical protein SEA_AZULA_10 [Gordonia phage Azula]
MPEHTSTVTVKLTTNLEPEVFESTEPASIEASDAGELLVETSDSVAIFARGQWISARATRKGADDA